MAVSNQRARRVDVVENRSGDEPSDDDSCEISKYPRPISPDTGDQRSQTVKTRISNPSRLYLCLLSCFLPLQACSDNGSSDEDKVETIVSNMFDTDPTLQDSNDDGVKDWVIRDRESDHIKGDAKLSLKNGVLRSENGDCLDSRPRMDYPDHTEVIWSARAVSNDEIEPYVKGKYYADWNFPGAQTWINFEYDVKNAHWAAVFTMIYKHGDEQVLYIMNQIDEAKGSTNLGYRCLYVQKGLPLGKFVDVKLHLYISDHQIGITVNGEDKGKVDYELKYEAESKDDRFMTMFVPQGVAEWKSLTVQVAEP